MADDTNNTTHKKHRRDDKKMQKKTYHRTHSWYKFFVITYTHTLSNAHKLSFAHKSHSAHMLTQLSSVLCLLCNCSTVLALTVVRGVRTVAARWGGGLGWSGKLLSLIKINQLLLEVRLLCVEASWVAPTPIQSLGHAKQCFWVGSGWLPPWGPGLLTPGLCQNISQTRCDWISPYLLPRTKLHRMSIACHSICKVFAINFVNQANLQLSVARSDNGV